jgi:hypothetical protein
LNAFTAEDNAIIDGDYTNGGILAVTIESTDIGFEASDRCGTWTRIS